MSTTWPRLTKGHGTGNDFVLVLDPDGELALTESAIAALTDRRRGIGGDGFIRAIRTRALLPQEPALAAVLAGAELPEWFMDYRNQDGSRAEMCGNGVRVFVQYLRELGVIELPSGEEIVVGTRAGALRVRAVGVDLSVAMGRVGFPGGAAALAAGHDVVVGVRGLAGERPGLSVTMPNPHVVLAVASDDELVGLDLVTAPVVAPVPRAGTNVEIVHVLGEIDDDGVRTGELRMRVSERGVGETESCGTGACAAAAAARAWGGQGAPDRWRVQVPGGVLTVAIDADGEVELTGPAVLVAHLDLVG